MLDKCDCDIILADHYPTNQSIEIAKIFFFANNKHFFIKFNHKNKITKNFNIEIHNSIKLYISINFMFIHE
jgi:hypothetical protein